MVLRTMVTVVVYAVIEGESGDSDGYNGYAYDGDCGGRGGNRGDDGDGDGYYGYAGESDCGSRRGTRGESGDGEGYNGYAGDGDGWERDGDGIAVGDGFYSIVTVVTKVYTSGCEGFSLPT